MTLTLFEVLDVAAGQSDPDLVDFGRRHWGAGSIVFLFSFGDVTHCKSKLMSQEVTGSSISSREK